MSGSSSRPGGERRSARARPGRRAGRGPWRRAAASGRRGSTGGANGPWMIESVWLRWPIMANHHSPNPSVTACARARTAGTATPAHEGGQVPSGATTGGAAAGQHDDERDDEAVERGLLHEEAEGAGQPREEQEAAVGPDPPPRGRRDRDGREAARQQLAVGGEALEVGRGRQHREQRRGHDRGAPPGQRPGGRPDAGGGQRRGRDGEEAAPSGPSPSRPRAGTPRPGPADGRPRPPGRTGRSLATRAARPPRSRPRRC